jgi:hypothetical protein
MATSSETPEESGDGLPEKEDDPAEDSVDQEGSDRGVRSWSSWAQPICEGILVVKLILELIHGSGG